MALIRKTAKRTDLRKTFVWAVHEHSLRAPYAMIHLPLPQRHASHLPKRFAEPRRRHLGQSGQSSKRDWFVQMVSNIATGRAPDRTGQGRDFGGLTVFLPHVNQGR